MRALTNGLHKHRCMNARRSQQGQSYLEFALIVPVFALMLICVAIISQGFNLKMVLNGAAYEGARVWAKNPVAGDPNHCSPPACDPDSGENNFEKYVIPVVRQYVKNNGFDGDQVLFFSQTPEGYDTLLRGVARNPQLVSVTLLYPYDLPIGNFASGFKRIMIIANCTMKRGG